MDIRLTKGGIFGLTTLITFISGEVLPLFILLVLFEVMDYISGMYVAYKSEGFSSKIAVEGFFKKFFYFFLVFCGFGFDFMITKMQGLTGISLPFPYLFGILSLCYLLSTEVLSILENLEEIGISVPFLTRGLKTFRNKIDEVTKQDDI